MLVIGSTALKQFGINLPRTKGSDLDLIGTDDECNTLIETLGNISHVVETRRGKTLFRTNDLPIEFEIAKPGSSAERLIEIVTTRGHHTKESILVGHVRALVAYPSVILALKLSHRYLRNSPHFLKTMDDIIALENLAFTVPDALQGDWMKQRMEETYYYAHPSLDQSKQNFFKDDNVNYIYDHDSIHEAVKTFSRPAFEYIKKDTAEVFCSKEKFFASNDAIRLASVLEEAYVLALERHQIPNDFKPMPLRSFEIALMKVCTSIASGWWREYAWEHYYDVLSLYGDHYVERFLAARDKGMIKPYAGNAMASAEDIVAKLKAPATPKQPVVRTGGWQRLPKDIAGS